MMEWFRLARSRSVVRRASAVAAVVGVILVVINHGDAVFSGDISLSRALRMVVSALVPYCVSTYSSVSALRERMVTPEDASLRVPDAHLSLDESARHP